MNAWGEMASPAVSREPFSDRPPPRPKPALSATPWVVSFALRILFRNDNWQTVHVQCF